MLKNYECPYLENSLMLSPTSEVRPCCRFDVSRYDIKDFTWDNQTPLAEFYQKPQFQVLREQSQSGQKVAGCHRCYREEELGIKSMRLKDFPAEIMKNSKTALELSVIELGVGRVCNLKCRTCDPYFSTKWDADANEVSKPIPEKSLDVKLDAVDVQSFQKTKSLKITGGEPFYHPSFERLVARLVEAGRAEHIDIEIFTNGTRAPSLQLLETLKKFKSLTISISIDGFATQNTYIRHPSRWIDVESTTQFWLDQMRTTNSLQINIAVTVSILNILSLFDLFRWAYKIFDKNEPRILIQNVSDPKHLNISCWPPSVRQKIHDVFYQKKLEFLATTSVNATFLKRLENIEKKLVSDHQGHRIAEQFWQETLALDKKRQESFSEVFPELFLLLSSGVDDNILLT